MKGGRAILTFAILLVLLVATPAPAAGLRGGGHGEQEVATAVGEITSIDYHATSFVIAVRRSNKLVESTALVIQAVEGTTIKECVDGVSEPIDFDEIDEEDWVRVDGMMGGVILVARRITVDPENIRPE